MASALDTVSRCIGAGVSGGTIAHLASDPSAVLHSSLLSLGFGQNRGR